MQDPNWRHTDRTDHISGAFRRAFRRIGQRRYPPYAHPAMARDLFDIRTTVCLHRMEINRWELAPQTYPQHNEYQNLRTF